MLVVRTELVPRVTKVSVAVSHGVRSASRCRGQPAAAAGPVGGGGGVGAAGSAPDQTNTGVLKSSVQPVTPREGDKSTHARARPSFTADSRRPTMHSALLGGTMDTNPPRVQLPR